jgi:hypothetical protein
MSRQLVTPSSGFACAVHGYVLLGLAGFFHGAGDSVERFLLPLLAKLTVGIGARPGHAARCARQIAASREAVDSA